MLDHFGYTEVEVSRLIEAINKAINAVELIAALAIMLQPIDPYRWLNRRLMRLFWWPAPTALVCMQLLKVLDGGAEWQAQLKWRP
ncbi:hypothetical protein M2333_002702 [Sphingobium sp. B11D3B]|uniref:hypothetical protein n=1 Tax=Sphingobium sp. B11D3B TaxID=2940575 RepID=UPI002226A9AB|nr:hypothetical protein [Sphingobium sp. B11D3B]MCW2389656.1 hypothetical protein [Sphingobium sp. B11D3B]